jgi:hypothetical protein
MPSGSVFVGTKPFRKSQRLRKGRQHENADPSGY